ncbi:hypothetical protein I4U23_010289 [Adineta vaga]|nr:hypothetical protein I4U23_010289 [Adineta vaga]
MSTSLSTMSQTQSQDKILHTFHELTELNIEDCIYFLTQYNWKLQDIVEDYCNGKEFKGKFSNAKSSSRSASNTENNNDFGSHYAKDNKASKRCEDDDRYYALLLQQYGDGDESARKRQGEYRQQPSPPSAPPQQQSTEKDKKQVIYHERQEFLRCGIHSLNNLFQIPHLFTHKHLDAIVHEFDKNSYNNDYGRFYIGDYDLRVLIEAIKRCGYYVRQVNFYNGESLQHLPWDSYFGLLININSNHWFTIKNLQGIYYNLDSTFSKPSQIGSKNDLVNYLIKLIYKFRNIYIFTVSQERNSLSSYQS